MSLNIQVTANKCDFSNEFSEGFDLPAHSQVALTKCNLSIPVFVQNILYVPEIPIGERLNTALIVVIDGIANAITWTALFTAHQTYPSINAIEPNIIANDYFSGDYQYFTNNRVYLNTNPANVADGSKPPFSWVLAKAINDNYDFYRTHDISNWESQSTSIGIGATNSKEITLIGDGGHNFNECDLVNAKQTEIKLNCRYDPWRNTLQVPINEIIGAGQLTDWVAAANTITASGGGVAMYAGNQYGVDINGGYIRCVPEWVGGELRWGFSLSTGDLQHSAAIGASPIIDVGVLFTNATEFRIIDGISQTDVYDGGAVSTVYSEKYSTSVAINGFTNNDDKFFIVVQRGTMSANSTSEYIFNLYVGGDDDISLATPTYTWKRHLQGTTVIPTEVAISSADVNILHDLAIIPAGLDSTQQRIVASAYNAGSKNTFSIQPNALEFINAREVINFWNTIGIHSLNESVVFGGDPLLDDGNDNTKLTTSGTDLNKTLSWVANYKDEDDTRTNVDLYWVGINQLSKFYNYRAVVLPGGAAGNQQWAINGSTALEELPKQLSVYINNLDIKNFQGSYHALSDSQTQTGQTRLVSTIPFEIGDDTSTQDAVINYETFNPYYRPLSNPNPLRINQLMTEISFKDANTDRKKVIETINGLVRVEYNIRSGSPPKKNKNSGLVSVI